MLLATSCSHKTESASLPKPTAFGAAIVESSGGKQFAQTGRLVAATGRRAGQRCAGNCRRRSSGGIRRRSRSDARSRERSYRFERPGHNQCISRGHGRAATRFVASTADKSNKKVELKIEEIALGYQQTLGRHLNDQYCERCHNPESTVERVSNYDNLEIKPHPFTEGDTLNKISDADLTAIISHGGPALNKSALMPAWGNTLSKSDIQALISYIRAISDPPSRSAGPVYAKD